MPTIGAFNLAPGKSLRMLENVAELTITAEGMVEGDRKYMVVEGEEHINTFYERGHEAQPGHFLSQREDPILTQIIPELIKNGVVLRTKGKKDLVAHAAEDSAANRIPVSIHSWQGEGVNQGPVAAAWLEETIGRPAKLVAVSNQKPRYVEDNPLLGRVGFSDGFALTGTSAEAYDLLNRQLAEQGDDTVPTNRTRTTFTLFGLEVPNSDRLPEHFFPEDYVKAITVCVNGLRVVFKRYRPCARCPVPDTNQETGVRNGRPIFAALSKLGHRGNFVNPAYGSKPKVFFSQNYVVEFPDGSPPSGSITIPSGMEVMVEYDDRANWIAK